MTETLEQLIAQRNQMENEIGRLKHLILMADKWSSRSADWRAAWGIVRKKSERELKMVYIELATIQKEISKKQNTLL